jgi:hypothetical protein
MHDRAGLLPDNLLSISADTQPRFSCPGATLLNSWQQVYMVLVVPLMCTAVGHVLMYNQSHLGSGSKLPLESACTSTANTRNSGTSPPPRPEPWDPRCCLNPS